MRRELSTNTPNGAIDGVADNKGYTGHEMLDQLDLVHMNERDLLAQERDYLVCLRARRCPVQPACC